MVYVSKLVPVKTGNKGSIIIAFIFIIILTITAASYFIMIGGRSAFTANQLKRAQAINCAEAALYETFNRFRYCNNTGNPVDGLVWDAANNVAETITIDGVNVDISYVVATKKISATVDYDDIRM